MPTRISGLVSLAALAVVAAIVYLPALWSAGFLNYDDVFFFDPSQNGAFDNGGWGHVLHPTMTIANAYLPVSHGSLLLDLRVFGTDAPFGVHLHSLLLHVLAAFALARLFGRFGFGELSSTVGAALFLVHPALVESTAWVASRKDLLSGLFGIMCLSATWRGARGGDARQSWLAALWALLAIYSKGTAVVLPLFALPMLVWGTPRDRSRPWAAFALMSAVVVGATLHHMGLAAAEGTLVDADLGERVAGLPGVWLHYLSTALWPASLDIAYAPVWTLESFRASLVGGVVALALFVVAIVLALRSERRWTAAGLCAFAVALAPFNTALPASSIAAADRYLYLAIPGLALALLGLGQRSGTLLAGAAAVALMFVAGSRAQDFVSSASIWQASVERDPRNSTAQFNLAQALGRVDVDGSEAALRAAVEHARYPEHRYQAELALMRWTAKTGRQQEAVLHAEQALAALRSVTTGTVKHWMEVDLLLEGARQARRAGDEQRAIAWLSDAQSIGPEFPEVHAFAASARLGAAIAGKADHRIAREDPAVAEVRALLARAAEAPHADGVYSVWLARAELADALGQSLKAQGAYAKAIAIDPLRVDAYLGKAQGFLARGIYSGAEKAARAANAANREADPRVLYVLGLALGGQGKLEEAQRFYEAYLQSRPDDRAARKSLAAVLSSRATRDLYTQDPDQLERVSNKIAKLDPTNAKLPLIRAIIARGRQDMQAAIVFLETAQDTLPGDAEVDKLWVQTQRDRGYELLLGDPDRRGSAFAYFRTFLDHAGRHGMETGPVINLVDNEWSRIFAAGRDALIAERLDAAERLLKRCLRLKPKDSAPRQHLGYVYYARGESADLEAALKEFHQRGIAATADTLAALYEVQTLRRLEREDEALERADSFLLAAAQRPAPEAGSPEENDVVRLRGLRDALAQRLGR